MIAYECICTLGLRSAEVTLKRPLRCTTAPSEVSSTTSADARIQCQILHKYKKVTSSLRRSRVEIRKEIIISFIGKLYKLPVSLKTHDLSLDSILMREISII